MLGHAPARSLPLGLYSYLCSQRTIHPASGADRPITVFPTQVPASAAPLLDAWALPALAVSPLLTPTLVSLLQGFPHRGRATVQELTLTKSRFLDLSSSPQICLEGVRSIFMTFRNSFDYSNV